MGLFGKIRDMLTYEDESEDVEPVKKEVSLDYNDENNVETEYEKKFRSKGMPIYHFEAILYDKFTVKEK